MKADGREALRTRPGEPQDVAFLWDMLYEAVSWHPEDPKPLREEVLAKPQISHYVEGWGRADDTAVIALGPDGIKAGAAWYRVMPPEDPGYGFVDAATPEVSIAVAPGWRGAGVGETLLRALVRTARSQGFEALSLSVAAGNQAIKLYKRIGFREVGRSEGSLTMRAEVSADGDAAASDPTLDLTVLRVRFAICRLDAGAEMPVWATKASFFSVTRTEDELSVVCPENMVPAGDPAGDVVQERGWLALKLEGPFDLSMIGILASLASPLAEAGASIFAVSTFDTDYVLVRQEQFDLAVDTLRAKGHRIDGYAAGGR